MTKCVICNYAVEGYGHNPDPFAKEGRCCSECNWMYVIPARICAIFGMEVEN